MSGTNNEFTLSTSTGLSTGLSKGTLTPVEQAYIAQLESEAKQIKQQQEKTILAAQKRFQKLKEQSRLAYPVYPAGMPDPSLLEDEAVDGIVTALKRTSNGLWSDLGLDGYILSEKGGQILVCKRGEEQRIKEFSVE